MTLTHGPSKGGQNIDAPGNRPKPPGGSQSARDAARLALWGELVAMLWSLEFPDKVGACVCCGGSLTHLQDCKLSALLARARELDIDQQRREVLGNAVADLANAIQSVRRGLESLSDRDRLTVFSDVQAGYCTHCGCVDPDHRCQCWNDE